MLIQTYEDYLQALDFIAQSEILAFDTETTGLNVRKDKVIGFSISNAETGIYVPIWSWNGTELVRIGLSDEQIEQILWALQAKKLLMFNASFDARITANNLGVDLLQSLYADVLLMKHTCDEEFPFGLKEIATKLWGHDVTKEKEEMQASIRANGGSAKEYYKASTETLARYGIKDGILTYREFNYYSKELQRQGLEAFYYNHEVLPLYREVTVPMEAQGVRLDIPYMNQSLADINQDLARLESDIQFAIAPDLAHTFTDWFLNKELKAETKTGKVPVWAKKYATRKEAWEARNPGAYMFNLQSGYHLKKLFFDTYSLEPLSRTPTGLPQCDENFLKSVRDVVDWVPSLIEFNKLFKLKSTYIERLLNESEDGRFYPRFQQHRTVSGRYAGDLQQLPRPISAAKGSPLVVDYTNRIRRFILPDVGHQLLSADYSQLEPTIFAHVSGDPALQLIFNSGLDFYSEVAMRTERLANVSSDKKASNYLGTLDKAKRQNAKKYALGIAYGETGYKLQFELGVSQAEGDKLVQDYWQAFPALRAAVDESHDEACYHGFVRTESGRIRHLPRAKYLFEKYGMRLRDSLQLWKDYNDRPEEYARMKQYRKEFNNLLNNSFNVKIQGLAASILSRASINMARILKNGSFKSKICLSVHDQLVLTVPHNEIDQVSALLQYEMQNVVKLAVPLIAEPVVGNNLQEAK